MKINDFVDDVARSVGFLSRISVPSRHFIGHDGTLSRAVGAFPVAGLLISLPSAALFAILLALNADPLLCAFLALGLQAILTGALHEDGLSDTADGIGGGRDRESALVIMKDSRIGSYGAVALILSFAIRASALATIGAVLTPTQAGVALTGIAALSRAAMVWHWSLLPPARSDGVAASAGMPETQATWLALFTGALFSIVLAGGATSFVDGVVVVAASGLVCWGVTQYIGTKIGGHTGDTIGASQQLAEVTALSTLAVLL
jgi:adenosylcobinamide-GDP ribazoletransferase